MSHLAEVFQTAIWHEVDNLFPLLDLDDAPMVEDAVFDGSEFDEDTIKLIFLENVSTLSQLQKQLSMESERVGELMDLASSFWLRVAPDILVRLVRESLDRHDDEPLVRQSIKQAALSLLMKLCQGQPSKIVHHCGELDIHVPSVVLGAWEMMEEADDGEHSLEREEPR